MAPVKAIFVGSSTGGPQAVTRLMIDLGPAAANLPVLIAQHMPPMFTAILADHITKASGRPTREGVDGERCRLGGSMSRLAVSTWWWLARAATP